MSVVRRAISAWLALTPALLGCSSAAPRNPPASPAAPAPTAAASATPPAEAESKAESKAEPAPLPSPPEPEPAPAASPPADHVAEVSEACTKLCAQATEQCSAKSARKCRANCERYEGLAASCGEATLAAVHCQAATPGLVCSNVVGPCAAEFQRLSACESGQTPTTASDTPAAPAALPAGWVKLTDDSAGFSVGLPKLAEPQTENGNRTWRVQDAAGVSYVVAVMPPFQGAVTDKVLVQKMLVILGQRCQKDMKIHGRFQSGVNEAVRFDSNCMSGESWHGMLRISQKNVIMTAEIVPPGKTPLGEAYYYSFSYL